MMNNREPLFLDLAKIYSCVKALHADRPDCLTVAGPDCLTASDTLAAVRRLETALDHLFIGARIASALLAEKDADKGLPAPFRAWFEAELARRATL